MPSFSLIRICICILLQILQSVRKEVEGKTEKKPKFWPLVSRKWLGKFSYVYSPTAQALVVVNITVDGVDIIGVKF